MVPARRATTSLPRRVGAACALLLATWSADAGAVTSSKSAASTFGGNGHNQTFDGRVYIVRRGGSPDGWFASVFRPQRVTRDSEQFPQLDTGAFGPFVHIQDPTSGENALAICEESPDNTPFRCNGNNDPDNAGSFLCYDLWIIDSNAEANQDNSLHRRRLFIRTDDESNADATVRHFEWRSGRELLGPRMKGIEPTITRDGKFMVYQGHPDNDGKIDILVYTYNPTPCAATGWTTAKSISALYADTTVRSLYRLGERQLRGADGTLFSSSSLFHGAYPWLFPSGDAIFFAAAPLPCRSTSPDDPPGCGPRRGALSVIGYPTNWGVAHIDGGINPDTDNTVRLFFSSPGPLRFSGLPQTSGVDVWPMFGSNTSNYAEIVFDDGLDGQYAGYWHMNESVNNNGDMDRTRTPDVSGYFGTGILEGGVSFPLRNNGALGKAIEFNGSTGRVRVPNSTALNPVNALTVEMDLFPHSNADCDGNNNYRVLLQKGAIGQGAYSIVLEENQSFQARVRVGGQHYSTWSNGTIPVQQWSHIAFTYDGATGDTAFFINGTETSRVQNAPGAIQGDLAPLMIGGPEGGNNSACPDGNGGVHGLIDEVRISRVVRYGAVASSSSSSSSAAAVSSSSSAAASSSSAAAASSSSSAAAASSSSSTSSTGGATSSSSSAGAGSSAVASTGGASSSSSAAAAASSGGNGSSYYDDGEASGGGDPGCSAVGGVQRDLPGLAMALMALAGVVARRARKRG